jgi:hypothetical protein
MEQWRIFNKRIWFPLGKPTTKLWDGQEDNDTIKLKAAFKNRRHKLDTKYARGKIPHLSQQQPMITTQQYHRYLIY